ncbi:MAG: hypothetical protein K2Z80_28080 [Xanthobacteraceae bacterium]|nr:hypothetical protein [Xanthobacteraceae bacterium]
MTKRFRLIVVLCAGLSAVLTTGAAFAEKKKKASGSSSPSIGARCAKQVGMTQRGDGRWYFSANGAGSPQEQAFYDCIDAHTKRR